MSGSRGRGSAGMAMERREITVHAVSFKNSGGAVYFASLPSAGDASKRSGTNHEGDKHCLVTVLRGHLMAMEHAPRNFHHASDNDAFPLRIVSNRWGKPFLLLGEDQGPAISFSAGGGKLWAALCGDGSEIGIDMAGTDEFTGDYPVHRVFLEQELCYALSLTGGDAEQASALLWSVKEAAVKAIGCAFHRVESRHVSVYPSVGREGLHVFPVCLSGKALDHVPISAHRFIWVYSLPQVEGWLSVACLTRTGIAARISRSMTSNLQGE